MAVDFQPKTAAMQVIEERYGRPVGEVIRDLYIDQGYTQQQVAAELGISRQSLVLWMARSGIPVRTAVARRASAS